METVIPITSWQQDIVGECLMKQSGGLCLPLGGGKTIVSITVSLLQNNGKMILIVVSKTLIPNWVNEIDKFYGGKLKYEILHKDYLKSLLSKWKPQEDTIVILTTPETLSKAYMNNNLSKVLIDKKIINEAIVTNYYICPTKPLLREGEGIDNLYKIEWSGLIVDEIAEHNNIKTNKCQALIAICAKNRWGLSGKMFPEPVSERILGYYMILHLNGPNNLPEMKEYISDTGFQGLNHTMVKRYNNPEFKQPKVNQKIIKHELSEEETKIYLMMKSILIDLTKKTGELKRRGDTNGVKKFSAYCLVLLKHLRQSMVCSLIPITNVIVDVLDCEAKSELSKILNDTINELHLDDWLNDPESIKSTRICEILKQIEMYKDKKILVYSNFKSCLDVIKLYLDKYNVFTIDSDMNLQKRQEVLTRFNQASSGVFCLTYKIGANGLNLQTGNVVILADLYWNHDTESQAEARIFRPGQLASEIVLISFTSNTGLEKAILERQESKLIVANELSNGSTNRKFKKINMKEVIKIISSDDNEFLIKQVKNYKSC